MRAGGTGPVLEKKVKTAKAAAAAVARLKAGGKKVVFTNGCFDILHYGHVKYLEKARSMGDALVVGVNSDVSVRRLKGPARPVNGERARAVVLAALSSVNLVVIFEEDTPETLIRRICPDVLVKGGDWKKKDIVGSGFVERYGGKVTTIRFEKGYSTTKILDRIGKGR